MTFHRLRRATAGHLTLLLCVAVSACGPRETLYHGVEPTSNGSHYEAAALMPQCGCVTLGVNPDAERGAAPQRIEVVARLHGAEVGSLVLEADKPIRVRYDWAGASNSDRYELYAYDIVDDPKTGSSVRAKQARSPVWSVLAATDVVESSCRTSLCSFGNLHMDQAYSLAADASVEGQGQDDPVEFASNGQVLEVAATARCGCMLVQNITRNAQQVTLRGTLNGETTGLLTLPWDPTAKEQAVEMIGFDEAGPRLEDFYKVTVDDVGGQRGSGSMVAGTRVVSQTMTASQHVRIVGHLDNLPCDESGRGALIPIQDRSEPVVCAFRELNLNRYYLETRGRTGTITGNATPALPGGNGTPPAAIVPGGTP